MSSYEGINTPHLLVVHLFARDAGEIFEFLMDEADETDNIFL